MFTLVLRILWRQKRYALINLFGLSIGMACCVLALVVIHHERGYDRFHTHADRVYRVLRERISNDQKQVRWLTDGALARALEAEIPEIERASKNRIYRVAVRHENRAFELRQGHIDEAFFDIFRFPFITGDAELLKQPYHIAIAQNAATRLFGQTDPIGKTIAIQERYYGGDYTIVAVLQDPPATSSIQFDLLHMTEGRTPEAIADWTGWQNQVQQAGIETVVRLREGANAPALEDKISGLIERNMGADVRRILTYRLQPLLRLHLYSLRDYNLPTGGNIQTLYFFAGIALLVLSIAGINFVNLATARSAGRAREVGLRKIVGAHRGQIARQFLCESVVLALLALLLALALSDLSLPHLNALAEAHYALSLEIYLALLPILIGFAVLVGLLAGLYPAFYLSSFQPVDALKSATGPSGRRFRQSLVVAQFAIAILLMTATDVVYSQLAFMQNKNLGFDREHVVLLPMFLTDRESKTNRDPWLAFRYNTVKQAFLEHPGVQSASAFRFLPGRDGGGFMRIVNPEGHDQTEWRMPVQEADEDFFHALNIPMLAGRTFSPDIERDRTHAYILNETAVQALGWTPEDAIGRRFGRTRFEGDELGMVIGVVKDFHYASLRDRIEPAAFSYRPAFYNHLALRVRDFPSARPFLEQTWMAFMAPDQPFSFSFLDEELGALYQTEQRLGRTITAFAGLAVLLACLGLFGLAAFTTERRTREIGIRKVLGASSARIAVMLTSDFLKLVLIANLIAFPVAHYALRMYLEQFAYRIALSPWPFVIAGLLAFVIALLTVSIHAFSAARANPVDALWHE